MTSKVTFLDFPSLSIKYARILSANALVPTPKARLTPVTLLQPVSLNFVCKIVIVKYLFC